MVTITLHSTNGINHLEFLFFFLFQQRKAFNCISNGTLKIANREENVCLLLTGLHFCAQWLDAVNAVNVVLSKPFKPLKMPFKGPSILYT